MIFTYIGGLITQIQSVIELNNLVFNKNKMIKNGEQVLCPHKGAAQALRFYCLIQNPRKNRVK